MNEPAPAARGSRLALGASVLAYVALALGLALTRRPWCDEAWFASPAWNLTQSGHMGTTVLLSSSPRMEAFGRLTYWMPPLHFLAQAAFYEVVGFGLVPLRLLSLLFGLVSLASCRAIAKSLVGDARVAVLAVLLCAVDNVFCVRAADGRMDVMSAALGHAGLACYLVLRERRLGLATLLGHALVAASGLTHPNGILPFAGLLVVQAALDRGRLGRREAALALVPYVLGGLGWGVYIAKDPRAFVDQFGLNMSGKLGATTPFQSVVAEVRERYLGSFGWNPVAPAWTRVRILIPLLGLGALADLTWRAPRGSGARLLSVLGWTLLLLLAFVIGNKSVAYLVHAIPLLAIPLAVLLARLWRAGGARRVAAVALGGAFVLLQVGASVGQIARDPRHGAFEPAAALLRERIGPADEVIGPAELAFALGFDRVRDDPSLHELPSRRPLLLVTDAEYDAVIAKLGGPPLDAFRGYERIAESGGYTIYRRR